MALRFPHLAEKKRFNARKASMATALFALWTSYSLEARVAKQKGVVHQTVIVATNRRSTTRCESKDELAPIVDLLNLLPRSD